MLPSETSLSKPLKKSKRLGLQKTVMDMSSTLSNEGPETKRVVVRSRRLFLRDLSKKIAVEIVLAILQCKYSIDTTIAVRDFARKYRPLHYYCRCRRYRVLRSGHGSLRVKQRSQRNQRLHRPKR